MVLSAPFATDADSAAMAANILAVLGSDSRAMGEAGRAYVAAEYSWAHSMERLFGTIVPAAMAHRRAALSRAPAAPGVTFVEA